MGAKQGTMTTYICELEKFLSVTLSWSQINQSISDPENNCVQIAHPQ